MERDPELRLLERLRLDLRLALRLRERERERERERLFVLRLRERDDERCCFSCRCCSFQRRTKFAPGISPLAIRFLMSLRYSSLPGFES